MGQKPSKVHLQEASWKLPARVIFPNERVEREEFLDEATAQEMVLPLTRFQFLSSRDGCISREQARKLINDSTFSTSSSTGVGSCGIFFAPLTLLQAKRSSAFPSLPSYKYDKTSLVPLAKVRFLDSVVICVSAYFGAPSDSGMLGDNKKEREKHEITLLTEACEHIFERYASRMPPCAR